MSRVLLGRRSSGSIHRHGGCGRGRGYRGALVLGAHSFSPRSTAFVFGRTRSRPFTLVHDRCAQLYMRFVHAFCMPSAFPTGRQSTISGGCGSAATLYIGYV
ncbi:hypothetical protein STVIR_4483 [Streptomyces viridochromogenes Tue57]|uniref:Uncharacterized protein n=1 Tax=Streptomyces viridochromogenes Tue57 TaxID=1160705 RepID=L8PGQ7_STRVR|nr:hypothetical protein STVIR_4483 [Streptomyces viridochromogenes Tue57]